MSNLAQTAPTACTLVIKKPTDFIKVGSMITLIYGQPGTRKTSYAGSAPNAILFDFDNGMRRVDEDYRCAFVPSEYLRNWNEVEAQLNHEQFAEFDTFIFDSVTKLLDYMADFAMKKDLKNKKNGGGLSLQGYGALGDIFKSFLAKLEMMNKNIVFVAHDKESKEGDSTRLRPDIVGASLGFVTRCADMIGYVEMINNQSVIQFTPTDRFYAKNSCGIEPQFLTSKYSLSEVMEKYKTGVNAKSAENKTYKSAMKNGLDLLGNVETVTELNEAFEAVKKMEHSLTSKVELFGAFKEVAESIECFFDKKSGKFEEFEKADLEVEIPLVEEPIEKESLAEMIAEAVLAEQVEIEEKPKTSKAKKDAN